ncbi:hypothetical protein [Pedobacter cryoconitis]|uniref:LTXXQ motif family protein n=1 Tax=Pedobacter cryoconitis TaxID=188932 RepID=A0A7X0J1Y6_9SPHI|nr:hypothetical protein [Pedobacter cryoconitis]MBB6499358.1 hypothetical protein [Pedobacter cryoconitis]
MKKTIICLALTFFTGSLSFAQATPDAKLTPKLRAETTIKQLQERLQLSDNQKTSLYNVFLDQNTKLDSLKKINVDKSVIKAQFKYDYAQITALLTADQLIKYNNWMAEKRSQTKH